MRKITTYSLKVLSQVVQSATNHPTTLRLKKTTTVILLMNLQSGQVRTAHLCSTWGQAGQMEEHRVGLSEALLTHTFGDYVTSD